MRTSGRWSRYARWRRGCRLGLKRRRRRGRNQVIKCPCSSGRSRLAGRRRDIGQLVGWWMGRRWWHSMMRWWFRGRASVEYIVCKQFWLWEETKGYFPLGKCRYSANREEWFSQRFQHWDTERHEYGYLDIISPILQHRGRAWTYKSWEEELSRFGNPHGDLSTRPAQLREKRLHCFFLITLFFYRNNDPLLIDTDSSIM